MDNISKIKFDDLGLVPAIIQEYSSNDVLMLAYMNKESLLKTIESETTWFYSRSRQQLWNKGETSGNYQVVREIRYDCDGDTLLIKVEQKGVACHTGAYSCFFNDLELELGAKEGMQDNGYKCYSKDIVDSLYKVIKNRKLSPVKGSYTNYLFDEGIDKILKKVGEESSEVIISSKNKSSKETIYEIADLVYHLLVLLVEMEITPDQIREELYNRHNS